MSSDFSKLYIKYKQLQAIKKSISEAFYLLKNSIENKGKILICGNGGSASDSEHMAGELLKSFKKMRSLPHEKKEEFVKVLGEKDGTFISNSLHMGIKAVPLVSFSSFITAFSNDGSFEMVFAQQVFVLGDSQDVLFAFSTTGNSKNIINAIKTAKVKGIKSILLTGGNGGTGAQIADVPVIVPASEPFEVQEFHLPVYHAICAELERYFYGSE